MSESTDGNAIDGGTRPLLLLDVDGVLNAFPDRRTPGYTRRTIDGYPIHFHREARQMVSALEEVFEIAWFTLWNHRAAPGIGPHVGLSDAAHLTTSWERGWDVAYAAGRSVDTINALMYAKTPLLPELVGVERHWVWIDDAHSRADHDYLVNAGFDPRRFRLVRTDPVVGLTWADVNRALEFARAVADRADPDDRAAVSVVDPSAQGPGSTVGRVDAVTSERPAPVMPGSRAEVNGMFLQIMARLGADGSHTCPHCGGAMRPVVYGLPSPELFEDADNDEVILGGCCIPSLPTQSQCVSCGHEVPRYRLGADLDAGLDGSSWEWDGRV